MKRIAWTVALAGLAACGGTGSSYDGGDPVCASWHQARAEGRAAQTQAFYSACVGAGDVCADTGAQCGTSPLTPGSGGQPITYCARPCAADGDQCGTSAGVEGVCASHQCYRTCDATRPCGDFFVCTLTPSTGGSVCVPRRC
jgi:hypothetical protein